MSPKVKVNGGIEEAVKMIQGLDLKRGREILDEIKLKDPSLAKQIEEKLVSIEDIIYLTPKMLVEFTKGLNLKDLGIALRGASKEVSNHILNNVGRSMKEDINDVLTGPPLSINLVQEKQFNIITHLKKLIEENKVFINKESGNDLV